MRTTVVLDDELMTKAETYTGIREKSALIREALRALIEREAARRLARLGGSEPDLSAGRHWLYRCAPAGGHAADRGQQVVDA